jgi:hypothetical protein
MKLRVACVGGLGLLAGCVFDEDADRDPPELEEIKLVDTDTIRLTFSEPLRAPMGLEMGVFRLSAAIVKDGSTSYYALAATDEDIASGGAGFDPVIRSVDKPIDLYAQPIDEELDIDLFDELGALPGCARLHGIASSEGGVFLHYLPGMDVAITDIDGNRAPAIAPRWVAHEDVATETVEGVFPEQSKPPMRIPCP